MFTLRSRRDALLVVRLDTVNEVSAFMWGRSLKEWSIYKDKLVRIPQDFDTSLSGLEKILTEA